jgi:hypothetical protein
MDVERREGEKGDASMDDEVCVNWRGKPCDTTKHGGMKAAVFVLGPPSPTLCHNSQTHFLLEQFK